MGSLSDLNTYSEQTVNFTDERDPGPRFNFDDPQDSEAPVPTDADISLFTDQLEIIEMVRPDDADLEFIIDMTANPGVNMNFPSALQPKVIEVNNIFFIQFINSVDDWNLVKDITFSVPETFQGSFFYRLTFRWFNGTSISTISWEVGQFVPVLQLDCSTGLSAEGIKAVFGEGIDLLNNTNLTVELEKINDVPLFSNFSLTADGFFPRPQLTDATGDFTYTTNTASPITNTPLLIDNPFPSGDGTRIDIVPSDVDAFAGIYVDVEDFKVRHSSVISTYSERLAELAGPLTALNGRYNVVCVGTVNNAKTINVNKIINDNSNKRTITSWQITETIPIRHICLNENNILAVTVFQHARSSPSEGIEISPANECYIKLYDIDAQTYLGTITGVGTEHVRFGRHVAISKTHLIATASKLPSSSWYLYDLSDLSLVSDGLVYTKNLFDNISGTPFTSSIAITEDHFFVGMYRGSLVTGVLDTGKEYWVGLQPATTNRHVAWVSVNDRYYVTRETNKNYDNIYYIPDDINTETEDRWHVWDAQTGALLESQNYPIYIHKNLIKLTGIWEIFDNFARIKGFLWRDYEGKIFEVLDYEDNPDYDPPGGPSYSPYGYTSMPRMSDTQIGFESVALTPDFAEIPRFLIYQQDDITVDGSTIVVEGDSHIEVNSLLGNTEKLIVIPPIGYNQDYTLTYSAYTSDGRIGEVKTQNARNV